MTDERYQAYQRTIATINRLGPAKLQADEEENLRDLAEGLLLAVDDSAAEEMITEARAAIALLVESERWLPDSAAELLRDIESCWKQPVSA